MLIVIWRMSDGHTSSVKREISAETARLQFADTLPYIFLRLNIKLNYLKVKLPLTFKAAKRRILSLVNVLV